MRVDIYFDKKNHSKKYSYNIIPPSIPSKENYAMAISEAMVLSGYKKKSRLSLGRYYNLILELIENSNIFLEHGLTQDKTKSAFTQAKILNDKEKPFIVDGMVRHKVWRVGYSQNNRLVIDIDSRDKSNLKTVKSFYQELFKYKFIIIKTNNGYWLISEKKYYDINEWLYDNCRLLYPDLLEYNYYRYKVDLLSLDTKDHKVISDEIKKSGLYNGVGSFDIIFIYINIKRQICTLRISKKHNNDIFELIQDEAE